MTDEPRQRFFTDEEIASVSTPLMEIQSSVMPLSIVFDVVAYLDRDHSETEMFDMIQRLRAAVE
jgi:hypothetical protein